MLVPDSSNASKITHQVCLGNQEGTLKISVWYQWLKTRDAKLSIRLHYPELISKKPRCRYLARICNFKKVQIAFTNQNWNPNKNCWFGVQASLKATLQNDWWEKTHIAQDEERAVCVCLNPFDVIAVALARHLFFGALSILGDVPEVRGDIAKITCFYEA